MESILSASVGLVGVLPGALLLWIRSDIKDHGVRIVRIETLLTLQQLHHSRYNGPSHRRMIRRPGPLRVGDKGPAVLLLSGLG